MAVRKNNTPRLTNSIGQAVEAEMMRGWLYEPHAYWKRTRVAEVTTGLAWDWVDIGEYSGQPKKSTAAILAWDSWEW